MYRHFAIACLLLCGCNSTTAFIEPVPDLVGKPAPDFTAPLLDGESFQLSEKNADHVIILDFWATWCGPCLTELPVLMRIADDYEDRGVTLYTVNAGEDQATIKEFLQENRWKLNVVLDVDGQIHQLYEVSSIPHLVIVDRGGIVKQVHIGYHRGFDKQLRLELDQLVSEKQPSQP